MANEKINLPPNFDPHDAALKKLFHEKADEKNFIHRSSNGTRTVLACGAVRKGKTCTQQAGFGTNHPGYGRCKFHGGASTGTKTDEGKAITAQNARKHGLYSNCLHPREAAIYNDLLADQKVSLEHEIRMLQAKIMVYLQDWRGKWEYYNATHGPVYADEKMKVWFKTGDSGERSYYHAGTIEDRPLTRALELLGRLIEKHARLTPEDSGDLLNAINSELKGASHGRVTVAWSQRPAQHRTEGGGQ